MSKYIFLIVSLFIFSIFHTLNAQVPQAFKYQSVVRNATGNPMSNANINIRATLHEGSATGLSLYQETHDVVTNQFGLINLEIGKGNSTSGVFPDIIWSSGEKWMEIEANFGMGYVSMGTSQLLSVPFALNFVPGPAGPAGLPGLNGTNGVDGINGIDGQDGMDGQDGAIGLPGLNGTNGVDGVNGIDGQDGMNGQDGAIGLPGLNGTNGVDGVNGIDGQDGMNGQDGAIGLPGLNGTNGVDGVNGIDGQDGMDGQDGAIGLPGLNGTNGVDGVNGIDGQDGMDGQDGAIGLPGLHGTNGVDGVNGIDGQDGMDGQDGAIGLPGLNGTNGVDGVNGIDGQDGMNGQDGIDGQDGAANAISEFGMFYGLTAGVGNLLGTDYAATIAVKTVPGSGRISFPRNGPTVGVVRIDNTSFTLPSMGTYEIYFSVHTTEMGQMQLELDGVDLPETVVSNMNPTAGGHLISGSFFVTTTGLNSILAVINPSGNAAALTITPADGASTHANSQVLTIKKIF
jgi:hypothetical protein